MKAEYDIASETEKLKQSAAYRFLTETKLPELDAVGITMEHVKTGARVFLIPCADRNKVFTIGFRTPPQDSTGVAHIIEHTVLCGSEKYPVKDPFVELVKGSLNTFLNAMTYPDKTLYPVASCNDRDFDNLMDVYLDAVFHPNIYREEKIFRQEGWHYEMENADAPLTLNGVVFNEMKGVYSAADGVMERAVMQTLYPGHTYGEDSGGDPDVIPQLKYGDYLDFHRRYYHPSNAFIYLYGNLDFREKLERIDRAYLSQYEKRETDSAIPLTVPFAKPVSAAFDYSLSESESEKNAVYLSLNTRIDCELDPVRYAAFQILDYILLEVPGAVLHEELIAAGIGDDVYGGFASGLRVPYFAVNAKNTDESRKGEFLAVIKGTLRKLADGGIDRDVLRAAINLAEFRAREADFGNYPKGLIYGLQSFDSWLYGADPCMHLQYGRIFTELKKRAEEGYFEELIRTYLLDNPNEAVLTFRPVRGLSVQQDAERKRKLAAVRNAMTEEERRRVVRETAELKAYQAEPSSPEDLLRVPMLKRADIGTEAERPVWELRSEAGIPVVFSNVPTSGIAYLKIIFNCDSLTREELPLLSFLKEVLGYIDTEKHTYADLATQINLHSGGIGFGTDCYPDLARVNETVFTFSANAKTLYEEIGFAFDAEAEMLLESKLGDTARIREILAEIRSGLKEKLMSAGHSAAVNRAGSFLSRNACFNDLTKGIDYYRMLEETAADYDRNADAFSARLMQLAGKLFTRDNMLIHLTCDEEGYAAFRAALPAFPGKFPETAERGSGFVFEPKQAEEGWMCASQVNYVARFGNFRNHGYSYTGVLKILKVLMSYDYLWNHIRVQGGAYGCMSDFGRSGDTGFVSYRDPGLTETDRVYDGIADYAEHFKADEREMTKSIIGAISDLDMPLTPLSKGLRGLSAWYSHVTPEDLQKERDEILRAQPEDIRNLAPLLRAVLADGCKCAIGNEARIRENADAFTAVRPLFNEQENEK